MDGFTASFLSGLAANLATELFTAVGPRMRKAIVGSEKEQALRRCLESAVYALVGTASASQTETDLLEDIFRDFFAHEDVGREVAQLTQGTPFDHATMLELFEESGYDAETLPGIDFASALTAFQAAFIASASEEPELQEVVKISILTRQTGIQQAMLDELRGLRAVLQQALVDDLRVANGMVIAPNAPAKEQIVFVLPAVTGSPGDGGKMRQRYLSELAKEVNLLPWAPIHSTYADPEKEETLNLMDVYTHLDTTQPQRMRDEADLRRFLDAIDDAKRVSALEALSHNRRLLLLGDPGSGKSTFVKYVTYVMTEACRVVDPAHKLAKLAPWRDGAVLPVWLELRYFADFIDARRKKGDAALLLDFLQQTLGQRKVQEFWPELDDALRDDSQTVVVLLDGLDEVEKAKTPIVIEAVNDFAKKYQQHRFVVTCRPYAWIGQGFKLSEFHETVLAPFDEKQIDHFVRNWYARLAARERFPAQESTAKAERLLAATRKPDLRKLAERPLLLTVMAQLHSYKGTLPDDRTELYAGAVDLLLERWEAKSGGGAGVLEMIDVPTLRKSDLITALYQVAYNAHANVQSDQQTADIGEGELRQWLAPYFQGSWDKAGKFVDYIRERAGLLIRHKVDAYTFPHRTFQEFLAACHLVIQPDYPSLAARLVRDDFVRWQEVFVLAAGHAARTLRLGGAIASVNELCPEDADRTASLNPLSWSHPHLAGRALLEIGLAGVQREHAGAAILRRVRDWLVAALREKDAVVVQQKAAMGQTLARLGDPRRAITDVDQMPFCRVAAGPFRMGGDRDSDEKPLQTNEKLDYDYWMSQYLVSQAQFAAFVDAGGYGEAGFWPEAKAAGVWRDGQIKGRWDNAPRTGPQTFGEPFDLPNHPVVGVTWYEALAFTRWLTARWQKSELLPDGWQVHLPSEAEWEKAARGGLQVPEAALIRAISAIAAAGEHGAGKPKLIENTLSEREYPWGNKIDAERANYSEAGIGSTTALGAFPRGRSPYGCDELSGNVWEWTRSLYEKYPYKPDDGRERLDTGTGTVRVLRGGASDLADNLRAARRDWGNPYLHYWNLGFRVVLAPIALNSEHSGL